MATQKFVFLDPATGLYKEQTASDTVQVPNGVNANDAVNKGQLDFVSSNLSMLIDIERNDRTMAVLNESSARISADVDLQAAIDAEAARALAAEGVLTSGLAFEVTRATAAETLLTSDLAAEVTRATAAELALGVRIDDEEAARIAAVSGEASARAAAVNAEEARALAAEAVLDAAIAAEAAARIAAVSAEAAARAAAVTAEENRAMAAEATLTADLAAEVTARGVAVSAEETARIAADDALDARLDILEGDETVVNSVRNLIAAAQSGLEADIAAEEAARIAADAALQSDIDAEEARAVAAEGVLAADIAAEETRALAAEAALQTAIDDEESARIFADNALSASIATVSDNLATETARAIAAEGVLTADVATVTAGLAQELLDRAAGDAATLASAQSYADGIAQGLTFKQSVRIAMATKVKIWDGVSGFTDLTVPAAFGTLAGVMQNSMGVTFADGDRVLITGGTFDMFGSTSHVSSTDAGIYVVTGGGTSLARASDMAAGSDASGAYVFSEQGSLAFNAFDYSAGSPAGPLYNPAPHSYVCSATKGSDTVGTSLLQFQIFSKVESLGFAGGLQKSGTTVTAKIKSTGGLQVDWSEGIEIKNNDATNIQIDANGISLTGALVGGTASNADAKHAHSAITIPMSTVANAAFVAADGSVATADGADCVGYARANSGGNAEVVVSGLISGVGGLGFFSVGETVYLAPAGGMFALSTFANIPSGKYAIPVGKKMGIDTMLVQIGTALLKA